MRDLYDLKNNNLLALLTVTLTCSLQDKSEITQITKFSLRTSHVFEGTERSHLCVIRSTSHLAGLKRSCHFDAQDTN